MENKTKKKKKFHYYISSSNYSHYPHFPFITVSRHSGSSLAHYRVTCRATCHLCANWILTTQQHLSLALITSLSGEQLDLYILKCTLWLLSCSLFSYLISLLMFFFFSIVILARFIFFWYIIILLLSNFLLSLFFCFFFCIYYYSNCPLLSLSLDVFSIWLFLLSSSISLSILGYFYMITLLLASRILSFNICFFYIYNCLCILFI